MGPSIAIVARTVAILVLSCTIGVLLPARADASPVCVEDTNDGSDAACGAEIGKPLAATNATATTGGGVIRIDAATNADFMQRLDCLDKVDGGDLRYLPQGRKSRRKPLYSTLPCAPEPSSCFRAVYDGYEDLLDLPAAEQAERVRTVIEGLIVPKKTGDADDAADDDGNEDGAPIHAGPPPFTVMSRMRSKTYTEENSFEFMNYANLHVDYFQQAPYVYTAVLYGEPSEDLLGGETVITDAGMGFSLADKIVVAVDDEERTKSKYDVQESWSAELRRRMRLESGLAVEPKKGRLLLFTGGGENLHGPLRVVRGQRPTVHLWYECHKNDSS